MIKKLYHRFYEDDVPALGAQLTYYLVLSFFPFLVFITSLLSYTPVTAEDVMEDLSRILPANAYNIVAEIIRQTVVLRKAPLLPLGIVATIWAASNGVLAIVKGINKAYDRKETRPFWNTRFISIIFTLALAVIILFSLSMLVFGEVIGEYLSKLLGLAHIFKPLWNIARFVTASCVLMLVFILLYKYMPNRRLKTRDVIPGSIFSTLGWLVLSLVFSYYINNFTNFANMYGSIGGIIALLLWLYWSSIIMLLGGEINATLLFDRKR